MWWKYEPSHAHTDTDTETDIDTHGKTEASTANKVSRASQCKTKAATEQNETANETHARKSSSVLCRPLLRVARIVGPSGPSKDCLTRVCGVWMCGE